MHIITTQPSAERTVCWVKTDINLHKDEHDLIQDSMYVPSSENYDQTDNVDSTLFTFNLNNNKQKDFFLTDEFVNVSLYDSDNVHNCGRDGCNRVVINVSGLRFETLERTLWRLPDTLLGNNEKRKKFWDEERQEYFLDRHRPSFQAILFCYQSGGKLRRPVEVPPDVFLSELLFFEFSQATIQTYVVSEGYVADEQPLKPKNRIQRIIYDVFEFPSSSLVAKFVSLLSIAMILLAVAAFCVETIPSMEEKYGCKATVRNDTNNTETVYTSHSQTVNNPFFVIESICVAWFTIEYVARLITCPRKITFLLNILNTVDLLAILPYFSLAIVMITISDISSLCLIERSTSMLAILRSIRIVRIFKLTKHFKGLQVLVLTIKSSMKEFNMLAMFFVLGVVIFSSMMWSAEYEDNSDMFESIPHSFWYAVITMTTVGYGDRYPITPLGKFFGSICVISGVLVIALPVPVIVTNFTTHYYTAMGKNSPFLNSYNK